MQGIELRDYQQQAIAGLRQSYARGAKSPLLVLPTGGGKTVCFCYIAEQASAKGGRVLILVHRQELLKQCSRALDKLGVRHGLIASGCSFTPHRVQVASVQTLVRRLERLDWRPTLIIIDECFPAGTLIDGRPIETLKVGDMVRSVNHCSGTVERKRITRLFKSRPNALCTVHFSDGSSVTCTAGHPFFVPFHGYYHAQDLKQGMPVVRLQDLRGAGCDSDEVPARQDAEARLGLLFPGVCSDVSSEGVVGNDGANEPQVRFGPHDSQEPYADAGVAAEDAGYLGGYGPQAASPWRQWTGPVGAAAEVAGSRQEGLAGSLRRVCGPDQAGARKWLSNPLQTGHRDSLADDGDRSGWQEPRECCPATAGPEERRLPGFAWVDRVEVHKPASDGTFGALLPDGFVYNVEVEGNHNYFAEGFLVHNCHHAVAGSWRKVVDHYVGARLLGVTATPQRLDGRGLGDVFDSMVVGPTIAELTAQGFLTPTRIYAPPGNLDLSNVHSRGGDYARGELAVAVDRPTITGDAVRHYERICPGAPAIAFCVSVEHARHVAAQFQAAGFRSESLDGSMDDRTRARLIDDLAAGRVQVLTSCDIVSEGTDIPVVTTAVLLRPTQSESLYLQQVGRVLRPAPGKDAAIILDHVGNVLRHGLPDDERDWSLDGRQPRSRRGGEQAPSVRQCPECFAAHAPAPECPSCGHVYEFVREVCQVEGELIELDPALIARQRRREQGSAQTLEQLIALGRQRGYRNPVAWAQHVHAARRNRPAVGWA